MTVDFKTLPEHFDAAGRLKPSGILYFSQEAAGVDAARLGSGWDALQQKNLFWAVIRTKCEILGAVQPGSILHISTWPMPTSRTAYPRMVEAVDETGKPVFRVLTLWVLMDITTRQMVLPGKSGVEVPGILKGNEPEIPRGLPVKEPVHTVMRTVTQQHLDRNGHMNNTRYMDWVTELLSPEKAIREFELCYFNEGHLGDEMELGYGENPEEFILDIHRLKTDVDGEKDRVFSAKCRF